MLIRRFVPMRLLGVTLATTLMLGGYLVACDPENEGIFIVRKGKSGFDADRSIATLSADEQSTLCDWSLETQGGAGRVTECGRGKPRVVQTKVLCLEQLASIERLSDCMEVSIGTYEQCAEQIGTAASDVAYACDDINHRIEACDASDAH